MVRFFTLLLLALVLSSCATQPPPKAPPAPLPRVTWGMANLDMWPDDMQAVIRQGMYNINAACGRELLVENLHTPMVTIHNKALSFFEAELINQGLGGTILGLADPDSRTFALYPAAFADDDVLRQTAEHELLHLLGLMHYTGPDASIMHPYIELGGFISSRDVREMNRFGWQCPNGR